MAKATILVVDDDRVIRHTLKYQLDRNGYEVISAGSGDECIYHLGQRNIDMILLDIKLPGMSGLDALKQIRRINSDLPVIMITAYGSIESAVAAMKTGAYEYITKPINFEVTMMKIEKALETASYKKEIERLRTEQAGKHSFDQIIGKSQAIHDAVSMADRIARSDASTILIQGETGVGKDLLSKAIHYESDRKDKPFMEITCTTLPETLLESELFGHERGAFTDARTRKEGLLELADGGTVFLNEIGHLEAALQVKLLSVLEHKAFRRLGGKDEINVDVRIIAATNRDLKTKVDDGTFREDLYYRLHVLPILVPPLRERREDIMLLAYFFLEEFNRGFGEGISGFSEAAESHLVSYDWPGNVRELRNAVERAVILGNKEFITPELLPAEICGQKSAEIIHKLPEEGIVLEKVEKEFLKQALDMTHWNQSKAAELLGLGRGALQYRMKKYGFLESTTHD